MTIFDIKCPFYLLQKMCVCLCVCGTNMNPNMLFLLETNKLIHNPYLFFFPNRNHTYRESKQQILLKMYKNGSLN